MAERTHLIFYFDPSCPWAWRTSLWAREVRRWRLIDVEWRFFSLAIANQGGDYAAEAHSKSYQLLRLLFAARRAGGNEAVDRLYLELGDAIHGQGMDMGDEAGIRACLEASGLDPNLLPAALNDPSTGRGVLEEHVQARERLRAFGVPTLALPDSSVGFYGPVIDPVPTGGGAVELWDHVLWLMQQPYLWEIKRERNGGLAPQPAIREPVAARR